MRKVMLTALLAILLVSPALAKKAPIERTVVDGITIAEVKKSSQFAPYYPATARPTKAYADVIVAVEVNEKGKVAGVDVVSSSVEGLGFDVSARDAVRQWRFLPAMQDGEAIPSVSLVRLSFAPPTMKAPEGFVFTETAPRHFDARLYNPHGPMGREMDQMQASFSKYVDQFANHDPRESIQTVDLPPCPARRNYNECMYDRRDMKQFGGTPSVQHHAPVPGVR